MRLWIIVLKDKNSYLEADVGMAIIEGNERAAQNAAREIETVAMNAGMRGVARYREVLRGKHYRATALIRTPCDPSR